MENKKIAILNIGAGKEGIVSEHLEYTSNADYLMINLDNIYFEVTRPDQAEIYHSQWEDNKFSNRSLYVAFDVFNLLERYRFKFDVITMYRFFEHLSRDKLLYFIYLLSTSIKIGGIVDVICPDYQLLAQHILNENPYDEDFEKHDIVVSTELFNEASDPHQNICTPKRIKRLFEFEGRFKVEEEFVPYEFDGRRIYFRSIIKRI